MKLLTISIAVVTILQGTVALKCYQCQTTSNTCVDNQCTGAWCISIITDDKATGAHKVEKMCAQSNPANSPTDLCTKDTQGSTTVQTCSCQLEDFCNGEAGVSRLMNDKNIQLAAAAGQPTLNNSPTPQIQPFGTNNNAFQIPNNPNLLPNSNLLPPGLVQPGAQPQPSPNGQVLPVQPPVIQPGQPPFLLGTDSQFPPNAGSNNTNPTFPRNPLIVPTIQDPNGQGLGAPTGPQGNAGAPPQLGVNNNAGFQPPIIPNNNKIDFLSKFDQTPKMNESGNTNPPMIHKVGPNGSSTEKHGHAEAKYTCACRGPPSCQDGKCRDDYCTRIEFDTRDFAHPEANNSPKAPQSATTSDSEMVVHLGCASTSSLPSGVSTKRIYSKLPYQLFMNGKTVTVNTNQRFCTGDDCNGSTMTRASLLLLTAMAFFSVFFM